VEEERFAVLVERAEWGRESGGGSWRRCSLLIIASKSS
jgi:hypothetical protein